MVRNARLTSMAMVPGIVAVMMVAGCPFPEKPFGSGMYGVGGAGGQPADTQTVTTGASSSGTGSGVGGASSGSGGPAEVQCPKADPINNSDNEPIDTYLHELPESKSCYALYHRDRTWWQAREDCQKLTSGDLMLNARLIEVSDLAEHQSVLKWLIDLRKGNPKMGIAPVTFDAAWTLGTRSLLIVSPSEVGAFFWAVSLNPSNSNPTWNIFPSENCLDETCMKSYWGNAYVDNEERQQPDSNNGAYCVRYAVGDIWNPEYKQDSPAFPGLSDSDCTQDRPYICEWSSVTVSQ